jgi:predicted HTH transcriptional regulator
MDISEIDELARSVGEDRRHEFKASMSWKDEYVKLKITKSIMAVCNISDGGWIILGVEEKQNNSFDPIGMKPSDAESFEYDHMLDHVNTYAIPSANFVVNSISDKQRRFVVIRVNQFEEIPVICAKDYYFAGKPVLKSGDIFTRTLRGKPQSSKVMNYFDLREIIDLATDRGIRRFEERASRAGLRAPITGKTLDEEQFENEVKDLL